MDLTRPYEAMRRDVPYLRHGDTEFLARIWEPDGGPAVGRPAVVDVHGGAWVDHDRRAGKRYNQALAEAGAVVVAIDFRTGLTHQHPCASADVAAAVRWLRLNSESLGIDPQRIVSTGSSSGGHLAMLAALRPNEPEHQGGELMVDGAWLESSATDASVRDVSPLWPPLDPLARYRYAQGLDTDHGRRLVASTEAYFADTGAMRDASVTAVIEEKRNTHLPPVWLVQAELDLNVPVAIIGAFASAYGMNEGECSVSFYHDVPHGFGHTDGSESDRFANDLCEWVHVTTR